MSASSPHFPRLRIDGRALLGLGDPADSAGWGAIRAAQLDAGRRLALFLLAANMLGAALLLPVLAPEVPRWMLAGWATLVATVAALVAFRRLASRHRGAVSASLAEVRVTGIEGAALGAVWSICPLAFGAQAESDSALGVWIVLSTLMAVSAVAMAALPLATIAFLAVLGGAVAAVLAATASPVLGTAALAYTLVLCLASIWRAKALVAIRAQEIAIAERDETISLLLREFEDVDADWLWETDAQRRIVRASARFARSLGFDPAAVNGKPLVQLLAGPGWESGRMPDALHLLADKLKRREGFRDLLLPVTVDGEERWWELTASPRLDERGSFIGFRGVGSDVTEARQAADRISRMARVDALTGLPNRLQLHEALAQALAEADACGGRCAFMMIDLDRFKAVNDTLGHPVGDRLLGRVAERLQQLATADETVGRLGGDEFALVLRDAGDLHRIERLAREIIETLSRPYEVDQHRLYIGASVGLAVGPRDGRTAETLIRSADLALYRSKDSGGGAFHCYQPELHAAAEERRVIEMALRDALAGDELHLAYQPMVEAQTGTITGFEALLRWTNPQLGEVLPGRFIPIAEEARLLAPIGEWVLQTACAEAARWDDHLRIAVNVSFCQLQNPAFPSVVAQALARSGLDPSRLELEIGEDVFLHKGTGAVKTLEAILGLGVRLSLDNFGTGYSSLGHLSRAFVSSIKVDRSFVHGAATGEKEALAIIRAVVALAQSLGIATTAEGVETEEQHAMAQMLGCTRAQGHYFGRPLPPVEARALATRTRSNAA